MKPDHSAEYVALGRLLHEHDDGPHNRNVSSVELFGCPRCGAVVFDREKHNIVLHLWERTDEVRQFDGPGSTDG